MVGSLEFCTGKLGTRLIMVAAPGGPSFYEGFSSRVYGLGF